MNTFLQQIAKKYYQTYKENIREFTFVFPNRRAGIFFSNHLTKLIDKPIFSPEITTINDCFYQATNSTLIDRTSALFKLYNIYSELSHTNETFDSFAYWGDILLADFDEIDKYLVNENQLFANIKNLKEIDNFDGFTENQLKALRDFWGNFLPNLQKQTNEEFVAIWKVLLPIYRRFREQLQEENTATEGMIFREVALLLKSGEPLPYFDNRKFVFIGFNALNPTEKLLFTVLRKRKTADFYWDYDAQELKDPNNKASLFHKKNTQEFPSKFQTENSAIPIHKRHFEIISVPSAVGQAKQIFQLISEIKQQNIPQEAWLKTAIVLPDETLLLPLLHSIPETVNTINITMGYPLTNSPVSSFVNLIFDLHKRTNTKGWFYHLNVSAILNHSYITLLFNDKAKKIKQQMIDGNLFYVNGSLFKGMGLLEKIFSPIAESIYFPEHLANILKEFHILLLEQNEEQNNTFQLDCDFVYQYYLTIKRFDELLKNNTVPTKGVNLNTVVAMIKKIVYGISIPFEGEPLKGLQIMGVLESRGLDFENLIIPAFNEGVFPKKNQSNSFISYTLRRGFGLPTPEYYDAVTAYNFYRLISRAKSTTMLMDNRTDGLITGEPSRYLQQLTYHYEVGIKRTNVVYDIQTEQDNTILVDKNSSYIQKQLQAFFVEKGKNVSPFSASSLNNYLNCPLKFYLSKVANIRTTDEITEEIKPNVFGSIYHKAMELLYEPLKGKLLQKDELITLHKNNYVLDKAIRTAFATEFFKTASTHGAANDMQGFHKIIANVIKKYVKQTILLDAKNAPFEIVETEMKIMQPFDINNGTKQVKLFGIIDRIDRKEGKIRILDYKTGKSDLQFKNLDAITERDTNNRPTYVFQTFFYALLYSQYTGNSNIKPEILSMKELYKDDITTLLVEKDGRNMVGTVDDFTQYKSGFSEKLRLVLEEIFDPNVPFYQTPVANNCRYCDFLELCNREAPPTY